MVGGRVVTERALEAWVDKYVSVTRSPVGGMQERLAGRIWAVGNDGFIIQPLGAPHQRDELGPQRFLPWHAVHTVTFVSD